MIVIPDDHETANNAWVGGASGHSAEEGDWSVRKAAGLRTFADWLPVSDAPWQQYRIGELATLFRIETRYTARDRPLNVRSALSGATDRKAALRAFVGELRDPSRTMMGAAQEKWLADGFAASRAANIPWQILAQQVVMGPTRLPVTAASWLAPGERTSAEDQEALANAISLAEAGLPLGLDRWDGYPAARERLLASARAANASLVVLTGDSHNGWAYELRSADGTRAGVEFAGQSVSSLGIEKRFAGDPGRIAADFLATNRALKWADTHRRGYMVLTVTPDRVETEYVFLPSRSERSTRLLGAQKLVTERRSHAILLA
jgi:alkaline phosphatase D